MISLNTARYIYHVAIKQNGRVYVHPFSCLSSTSAAGSGSIDEHKLAYYVTTPIYYANGAPHLGHLYTSVAADMIARYQRLRGKDVYFLTGTDDHGLKVQQAAEKNNQTPLEFTTSMAEKFLNLGKQFNISNSDFIRTTSSRHKVGVTAMWRRLVDRGFIYKGMYEGWYSVRDECFYSEDELIPYESVTAVTPMAGTSTNDDIANVPRFVSPESGDVVSWVQEESFFFRLSAFSEKLLNHYADNPGFIAPQSKRNEVIAFVRGTKKGSTAADCTDDGGVDGVGGSGLPLATEYNLKDLSISRTSFTWGIPVPVENIHPGLPPTAPIADSAVARCPEPNHVIYVWMDALVNYLSALGFDEACFDAATGDYVGNDTLRRAWPADVHIMGKDILRFHGIYWPAFLLAAGVPLPKSIFAHGWWVVNGQKMSKSIGNVITPTEVLNLYDHCNPDYVRYYLLSEVVFGNDGDFSPQGFVQRINSALANDFGNLIQRSASMINKHCQAVVPCVHYTHTDTDSSSFTQWTHRADLDLLATAESCAANFSAQMDSLNLYQSIDEISRLCRACNKYFDTAAPWKLAKKIDASLTQSENCASASDADGDDVARFYAVLAVTTEMIRRVAVMYSCVIPESADKIFEFYRVPLELRGWDSIVATDNADAGTGAARRLPKQQLVRLPDGPIAPIFPRIVVPAVETQEKSQKSKRSKKKNTAESVTDS